MYFASYGNFSSSNEVFHFSRVQYFNPGFFIFTKVPSVSLCNSMASTILYNSSTENSREMHSLKCTITQCLPWLHAYQPHTFLAIWLYSNNWFQLVQVSDLWKLKGNIFKNKHKFNFVSKVKTKENEKWLPCRY